MTAPILPILGIDPGFTGGWALVDQQYRLVDAGKMPVRLRDKRQEIDARALADIVDASKVESAWVEIVSPRPRQAGQFRFGVAAGAVHGVLETLGISMNLVSALSWKPGVGLPPKGDGETTSDHKRRSRILASRLWPDHAHRFARCVDDGVAEAALIAFYGAAQTDAR